MTDGGGHCATVMKDYELLSSLKAHHGILYHRTV